MYQVNPTQQTPLHTTHTAVYKHGYPRLHSPEIAHPALFTGSGLLMKHTCSQSHKHKESLKETFTH